MIKTQLSDPRTPTSSLMTIRKTETPPWFQKRRLSILKTKRMVSYLRDQLLLNRVRQVGYNSLIEEL